MIPIAAFRLTKRQKETLLELREKRFINGESLTWRQTLPFYTLDERWLVKKMNVREIGFRYVCDYILTPLGRAVARELAQEAER